MLTNAMYKIKQIPEDFVVNEETNVILKEKGEYSIYLMKKINENTETSIRIIADKLNIDRKKVGYAGLKDKNAITEQYISIANTSKVRIDKLQLRNIELKFNGYSSIPISLGDLKGNNFEIIIRNLNKKVDVRKLRSKIKFVNYFGEQRFSKSNVEIGKLIIKRRFKEAIELILQTNPEKEEAIRDELEKNPSNHVNAIRIIPKRQIMLYVHSYQSSIWNETAKEISKSVKTNIEVPLVGFGIEIKNKKINEFLAEILKRDDIHTRNFIIREMPEFSVEGTERKLYAEAEKLKLISQEADELNNGKYKIKVSFFLLKGCYATEFIRQLFC